MLSMFPIIWTTSVSPRTREPPSQLQTLQMRYWLLHKIVQAQGRVILPQETETPRVYEAIAGRSEKSILTPTLNLGPKHLKLEPRGQV